MNKRAYIFSLDGVLATPDGSLGFPCPIFARFIYTLHMDHHIIITTHRDKVHRDIIETWLNKHHIPFDKLFFTNGTPERSSTALFKKLVDSGYKIQGIFDSDAESVDAARTMGFNAVYALGDYSYDHVPAICHKTN